MDLSLRTQQLSRLFSYDKKGVIEESRIEILPFRFSQKKRSGEIDAFQQDFKPMDFCPLSDEHIEENKHFSYTIFSPSGKKKHNSAIILLHGLNERSWKKYLTWAEFLTKETGKPVILFPIAFHMNRSPRLWSNPREILPWVSKRKKEVQDNENLTFVNLALSSRLSQHPLRFYASGRESVFNLTQLTEEIKNGEHPLFAENASVHFFAYSIGALLSQVILLANPNGLFTDSRLFMFCGGSIFSEMNGNARDIMDRESYDRLIHYYLNDFLQRRDLPKSFNNDIFEDAFKAMIRPDYMQEERESFFRQACNRIRSISLKKDIVMPTGGIIKALGRVSSQMVEEMDFPFVYSHQTPFPDKRENESRLIHQAFQCVFGKAAAFL